MSRRSCLLLVALVLLQACGSARRSEPVADAAALSPAALQGERAFARHCHECHPGGEAGLGPALNNKPLPGWLIGFQVRNGLGAMPPFTPKDVSEEELASIVAYLEELRAIDAGHPG